MEAALGHSDDAVAMAVQEHRPPDHAGVPAERTPPEPVAENADGVGARVPHVVVVEQAPDGRSDAQRAVVAAGDQLAVYPPAAVAVCREVDRPREPAEDASDGRGPLGEGVDGPQGPHHTRPFAAMGPREGDEAVRLGHRQPLEENGVDEREDRGVGADPERERGDRDPREHRTPAQAPQRVPTVLPQLVGEPQAARATAVVPGALHATECTRWRGPGRAGGGIIYVMIYPLARQGSPGPSISSPTASSSAARSCRCGRSGSGPAGMAQSWTIEEAPSAVGTPPWNSR